MSEEKQTLYELLAGIVFFVLLYQLGNLFVTGHLPYTLGILLGGAVAFLMSGHMYHSLSQALLFEKEAAEKKVKLSSFVRMLFMVAALLVAVLLPDYFSVIAVVLGILSLKFSAYLLPLTHKVFNKFIHKGR